MSLRNTSSTGNIALRRFCTHLTFPDADDKPTPPPSPPPPLRTDELSSLAGSHSTETDEGNCSHSETVDESQLYFDFPQPPSTLRRMHSSPWCTPEQQSAPFLTKSERRHSVSPLLQCADNWIYQQQATDAVQARQPGQHSRVEMMGEAFVHHDHIGRSCVYANRATPSGSLQRSYSITHYREPLATARLPRPSRPRPLPPPTTPAPSAPLPHIPGNIRKADGVHLDPRRTSSFEPVNFTIEERSPDLKTRSFKSFSGSAHDNCRVSQHLPQNSSEEKSRWSFGGSRNAPKTVDEPARMRQPYVQVNQYVTESLSYAPSKPNLNTRANDLNADQRRASMTARSSPSLAPGNSFTRPRTMSTFGNSGPYLDLSTRERVNPRSTHTSTDRQKPKTPIPRSQYPPNESSYNSRVWGAYTHHGSVPAHETRTSPVANGYSSSRDSRPSIRPAPRSMYNMVTDASASRSHDVGVPRSFMDVTPDKLKESTRLSGFKPQDSANRLHGGGKAREESRSGSARINGEEQGIKKTNSIRRLLARAGKGFVDWGRQLTGKNRNN